MDDALAQEIIKQTLQLWDFKWHETAYQYLHSKASIRAVIKGNQGGGTAVTTTDAILRLLGLHPVEKRNRFETPIRFVSKCTPQNEADEENQQYVEFKRRFPAEFIKSDVNSRRHIMTVRNPMGGADRKVEFLSKQMDLDAFMSVQRAAYYQDEEIDRVKWDESQVRLLREGGDSSISLTPAIGMDWTYDDIWKRASKIYRSEVVCNKFGLPRIEENPGGSPYIEAFCWATDDNPVLTKENIERLCSMWEADPDTYAMRRYGVFKQVSGRVYKLFDTRIHVKPFEDVFSESVFREYWHFRIIDYHPTKPWYVSWVAVTPTHEWFVWQEFIASHDTCTDLMLRDEIKKRSLLNEDDEFNRATLIDPLSKMQQQNSGYSVFDDISMGVEGLRRITAADTKTESARENIRQRIKNSTICKVPGNNINKHETSKDERYGMYLTTIWFLDNCPGHIEHFRSWRMQEWKDEHVKSTRDDKKMTVKWSDFCRNIEFLGALNPVWYDMPDSDWQPWGLFRNRRTG